MGEFFYEMYPPKRARKIHNVMVNEDKRVVITRTLEDNVPSWFIFFVFIYTEGVAGEDNIIISATSCWSRKPSLTATGRNIAGIIIVFINDAAIVGLILEIAFFPSKPAPIATRASGDAITEKLCIVLSRIVGSFNLRREAITPIIILIIIGFFIILINDCFIAFAPFSVFPSTVRTITAKILKRGTQPIIIIGAIPDVPYILRIKATPSIAALLLYEACTNSPIILLSLIKSLAPPHIEKNIITVVKAQKSTYFISKLL